MRTVDIDAAPLVKAGRRQRGFTLIECLLATGLAALLAAMAWPSMQMSVQRAARLDAVQALLDVQAAQEKYRAAHGWYAQDLSTLKPARAQARPHNAAGQTSRNPEALLSAQGHYLIQLQTSHADTYTAVAVAQGPQARDSACATLSLQVRSGFGTEGPNARCWHR